MLRGMDAFTPAVDLAAAIRRKEISPVEVADLYLERIEQFDGTLNAFCHRADDEVRDAAKRAADVVATSDTDDLPPFFGVPLPIKDLNAVAGWPSTQGSQATSREPQAESDLVVERFVEAGFILLGMTNAPEFGTVSYTESEAHGITRNPWNTDHTPGGSSGGAGAAVASGMAPIAHTSDGGGSIRIPATCNGLVGLKSSRNRVPNRVNELEGLGTSGVLTRTVLDTATALDIIGRPDPLGWYNAPPPAQPFARSAAQTPARLRVGFTTSAPIDMPVDPACVAAVSKTVEALGGAGHDVFEVALSVPDTDSFVESFGLIWNTGSAGVPVEDWDLVEPINRALREAGRATDSIAYVEAVQRTQILARPLMAQFVDTFDVLVTPTMATPPPRCGTVWEGADDDPMVALLNCFPMGCLHIRLQRDGLAGDLGSGAPRRRVRAPGGRADRRWAMARRCRAAVGGPTRATPPLERPPATRQLAPSGTRRTATSSPSAHRRHRTRHQATFRPVRRRHFGAMPRVDLAARYGRARRSAAAPEPSTWSVLRARPGAMGAPHLYADALEPAVGASVIRADSALSVQALRIPPLTRGDHCPEYARQDHLVGQDERLESLAYRCRNSLDSRMLHGEPRRARSHEGRHGLVEVSKGGWAFQLDVVTYG